MKPAPFQYAAPTAVEDVLTLLAAHRSTAKLLAGGQSLVPLMNYRKERPSVVIDLNRVEALRNIHVDHDVLTLGAMVRYAEVERSAEIAENWPLLSHAIGYIAHQQIRSRGTIGGSLAQNHPGAEMPLVLLCLDAMLGVRGAEGTRTLPIDDFYTIDGKTTLGADEMLIDAKLPEMPEKAGWGFCEVSRRHGDASIVAAAAVLVRDGSGISFARIVITGVAKRPVRFFTAEAQIIKQPDLQSFKDSLTGLAADFLPPDTPFAPSWYRRDIAVTIVARAIDDAWRRTSEVCHVA
jgi:CO/xanthine dehydrogenase FAD-binding subunit